MDNILLYYAIILSPSYSSILNHVFSSNILLLQKSFCGSREKYIKKACIEDIKKKHVREKQ